MERSRLAIVIPALNEAATIAPVVAQVQRYGIAVVVDDGSTDATAEVARRGGAILLRHPANLGYDAALNSGFALAAELGCDYVITMDADGQHNPELLAEYVRCLDEGHALVLGARERQQRFGETVFSWLARAVWRVSDPLCGMKGYSMALYRKYGHFDSFQSVGTEMAIHAVVDGNSYRELPVRTRPRLDAPRFAPTLAANYKILRALLLLLLRYGGTAMRPRVWRKRA